MNTTITTPDTRIAEFAAAVRDQLSDLPADEVDELVDGLEADLAEQASESEDFALPDAASYAAELRAAAGLPERSTDAAAPRVPLRLRLAAGAAAASARVRQNRAGAWLLDFLRALRPVWWIARGWALYAMLAPFLGMASPVVGFPWTNTGGWILLCALMLLSVQWGRGRWASAGWLRAVRTVVSIVTAIALPFLVGGAVASVRAVIDETTYYQYEYIDNTQPGLVVDGERVRNVFAYDSEGNALTDVQLFDQSGRPLTTVGAQGASAPWDDYFAYGGGPVPVPFQAPGRAPVWNVYPLQEVPADEDPTTAEAAPAIPPFERVPAVDRATAGVDVEPSAGPTPDASATSEPMP